jgi:hypothetical protein
MIDAEAARARWSSTPASATPRPRCILMRLKSDLFELLMARHRRHAGPGGAAMGPPHRARRGGGRARLPGQRRARATPSPACRRQPDLQVFHAGTTLDDGVLRSSGGRVLCVTALGDSVRLAQQRALQPCADPHGRRALAQRHRPPRHPPLSLHPPGDAPSMAGPPLQAPGPLELRPGAVPLVGSRFAAALLRLFGWQVHCQGLPAAQGVMIVYPHTSNWDSRWPCWPSGPPACRSPGG